MEIGSLIGPAVVAAGVSGVISVVSMLMQRGTTLRLHTEKLEADNALAERKVAADISLAERKFEFDQLSALLGRRFELAEALVADAYRFRDMMAFVRNGFAFGNEGSMRSTADGEKEDIQRLRNTYFVPIERLNKQNEFIAAMMARQHAARAMFGDDTRKAFRLFGQAINHVQVASSTLIEMAGDHETDKDLSRELQGDIWEGMGKRRESGDTVGGFIEEAVGLIEAACKPALERKAPMK